jgi:YspA, cpYpsA-related SLOG family
MRVLVYGGRDYTDINNVWKVLDSVHDDVDITYIIDGAARGADTLGHKWALHNNIAFKRFPADWAKYYKGAGSRRNQQMLDEGNIEMAVEFPGSSGTRDMRRRLDFADILVIEGY